MTPMCSFKVYDDSVADLRMVGITLHQACVLVANLYMGLIISQWVSGVLTGGVIRVTDGKSIFSRVLFTKSVTDCSFHTAGQWNGQNSTTSYSSCREEKTSTLINEYSLAFLVKKAAWQSIVANRRMPSREPYRRLPWPLSAIFRCCFERGSLS